MSTELNTQEDRLDFLNAILLKEKPEYSNLLQRRGLCKAQLKYEDFGKEEKHKLFRSLLNVRDPLPIGDDFIEVQDMYLQEELSQKKLTSISDLYAFEKNIYLWQGDITTLKIDAIVNAANSQMLGCFIPCHACIDNVIHTQAGIQLRLACADLMKGQGEEETGKAKITLGYNLPSKYVLHTVGPIISSWLMKEDCDLLASCYTSCLELADHNNLSSIAFCCISTGEFHFPNEPAAEIALKSVRRYKKQTGSPIEVIFNVFKDKDYDIYTKLFEK